MDLAVPALLVATVLIAAVTDARSQRVPNWLTLPVAALALLLHGASGGLDGLLFGVQGWLVGLALLISFYAMGGMGAGDVKLLAAVGALVGPWRVIWVFFYTAIFGGVYALGIVVYSLISKIGWVGAVRRLKAEGTAMVLTGGEVRPSSDSLRHYPKLRYAIAVAAGVAVEHYAGSLGLWQVVN